MIYGIVGALVFGLTVFSFDQYQYFPDGSSAPIVHANYYDDDRPEGEYISSVSLPSRYIDGPFFPFFLRYDPSDNALMRKQCPDFEPLKEDGLNQKFQLIFSNGNLQITNTDYSKEDGKTLLQCHQDIYQIAINDSIYYSYSSHFYIHPGRV